MQKGIRKCPDTRGRVGEGGRQAARQLLTRLSRRDETDQIAVGTVQGPPKADLLVQSGAKRQADGRVGPASACLSLLV